MKKRLLKALILPALIFAVSACGSSSSSSTTTDTSSDNGTGSTSTTTTTDNGSGSTSTDSYATPTGGATISTSTSTIGHSVRTATSGSKDCLACHKSGGAAASQVIFTLAGSVSNNAGTALNTNGNVNIKVYPATGYGGTVINVPVDTRGNFYATKTSVPEASLVSFKLVSATNSKQMSRENVSGGCTSCHAGSTVGGSSGKLGID